MIQLHLSSAQNYQVTFEIEEEKPSGTFVGNLSSAFKFLSEIPHEEWGYVQFGFLTQSYIQSLLNLNTKTGILTTSANIDRESKNVCQSQSSCRLTFDVAVRSSRPQSSFFAIISVTLIIQDINDNAPFFPTDVLDLEIPESTVSRTAFLIDSASDQDAGEFSVQGYEIGQQDGDFDLDVIRKLDGSFTVKLIVNSPLDREMKDKYSVVIIAMDGGVPKKFGALSVNITVTDMNDNGPEFTEASYNVTVHENVTIGTAILTLKAVDADTGKNGEIVYRFSPHQLDTRVNNLFSIAPTTGELIVKNNLIYESGTFYKIIVEASDRGDQPQVTQVIATVHVLDVGNNAPTVEINLLSPGNSRIVNISESATIGTFVAHVNVNDKDTGENGEVSCIISDKNFELLSMTGKGYKVVIKKTLDRETQDLHSVYISCHDNGTPSLSASSSFLVSVSDENDFTPRFIKPVFTGSVPENKREFRTFMRVEAFDEDLKSNGEIRYYIDPNSTPFKFSINERSGHIRPDQVFDREEISEITFTILAVDKGSPALTGSARVKVTITDYNDNAPLILEPTEFSVMENKKTNTVVGTLNASDADEGENAKLMFVIKPEYETLVPFVVYPDGIIKTNRQLDREIQARYDFVVVVFDQGSPRLSSSANITVFVADDNDHTPEIKFPADGNNTVTIYSDIRPGQKVVQILAEDLDKDKNGISGYAIISGNEENLFVVDVKQGGIYLSKPVNVKQNRSFNLVISVYDGGNPSLSINKPLKILMKEANVTDLTLNQGETASNVIIVVVVVVVTLVLSVFMIMVICFLRKFDGRNNSQKKCNGSMIVAADEKYPSCFLDSQTRYLDNSTASNNSTDLLTYDPLSTLPKKKEVSFDLDETYERQRNDLHNSTLSTFTGQDMEQVASLLNPNDQHHGNTLKSLYNMDKRWTQKMLYMNKMYR